MSLGTPLKMTQRLAHGVSLVQSHLVKLREESRWGGREGGSVSGWWGGADKRMEGGRGGCWTAGKMGNVRSGTLSSRVHVFTHSTNIY